MARYQIIYWKEIPAQVQASDEDGQVGGVLSERFQQAIDAAAMVEGSSDEDAYLAGWTRGREEERPGRAREVLEGLLAELEVAYPPERLSQLVQQHRKVASG